MARVYLSPPHIAGREAELVAEAIESNWIAPLGPHVDAFERELAAVAGVPHAVALSSGTAALHLALVVHGIGAEDEVACSDMTFAASANANDEMPTTGRRSPRSRQGSSPASARRPPARGSRPPRRASASRSRGRRP